MTATETVHFRLTPDEKGVIELEAEERGYTVSELLRLFTRDGMARLDDLAPRRDPRLLAKTLPAGVRPGRT